MAIVTRYFSTAAAGSGDGTSWANRAQLINAGTWSTVITGFSFAGSDSLLCYIGPGTHTVTTTFAPGLFATPPTAANPIMMHGCDSSGVALTPSDPNWTADMPVTWDSTLPVIAATTSVSNSSLDNCFWRLVKFTSSNWIGSVISGGANTAIEWVCVVSSTSNTATIGISNSIPQAINCAVVMSGTAYNSAMQGNNGTRVDNIRIQGNLSASSGNRRGFSTTGTSALRVLSRICAFNNVGENIIDTGTNAAALLMMKNCVSVNSGTSGIKLNATASQTAHTAVCGCLSVGSGGYGIDAGAANVRMSGCRTRDNSSGDFTGFANYPTTFDNDTTDIYANQAAADAAEFVDVSIGDFRIKYGSPIWGMGYGCGDEPATSGGGGGRILRSSIIGASK